MHISELHSHINGFSWCCKPVYIAKHYIVGLVLYIVAYRIINMDKGASISSELNISFSTRPLFSVAFIFLYIYLMIYNLHQIYGIDSKDEDFVECTCKDRDKMFYKGLFGTFTAVWIFSVLVWKIGFGFADCYKL